MTSRWGSCSSKNNISFNNLMYHLDNDLQDYIIKHELLHTKIKNHSNIYKKAIIDRLLEVRWPVAAYDSTHSLDVSVVKVNFQLSTNEDFIARIDSDGNFKQLARGFRRQRNSSVCTDIEIVQVR